MFTHPDRVGQLARDQHRQMLAQASQRQLRRQHGHQAPRTPKRGRQDHQLPDRRDRQGRRRDRRGTPGAIWPDQPHPHGKPAGQAEIPGRGR